MRKDDKAIKREVLDRVFNGKEYTHMKRKANVRFGAQLVHVRMTKGRTTRFPFNINPTTLQADYEVWICGTAEAYFLLPARLIRKMYEHRNAYPDNWHSNYRVVTVDVRTRRAVFATPSRSKDLRPYFCSVLSN